MASDLIALLRDDDIPGTSDRAANGILEEPRYVRGEEGQGIDLGAAREPANRAGVSGLSVETKQPGKQEP